MLINVRDFGAVGDGVSLDSPFIQRAIDTIDSVGGGELFVPPGVYRCGALKLASNITINISAGAMLLASPDIADHFEDPKSPDKVLAWYFIHGENLENVCIQGDGIIDGSGGAYWEEDPRVKRSDRTVIEYIAHKPKPERPVLLRLKECRNVRISDIMIRNAACYTIWILGCDDVKVRGIAVKNDRNGPNTDALDIDCSANVMVSDCDIATGDDGIALKSDSNRLGYAKACENVMISNCVISAASCGIRTGYEGDAPIRDCVLSNLSILNARHGLNILSVAPDSKLSKIEKGTPVERIAFSNIVMKNVGRPIFVWAGNEKPVDTYDAYIRHVSFSDLTADSVDSIYIGTETAGVVSDLSFNNVSVAYSELAYCKSATPMETPDLNGTGYVPGAAFFKNVDGLRLRDFRIDVKPIGETPAADAMKWTGVENFVMDGVKKNPDGTSANPGEGESNENQVELPAFLLQNNSVEEWVD